MKWFFPLDKAGIEERYEEEFSTKILWEVHLLDGCNHQFLKNYGTARNAIVFKHLNPGVLPAILKKKSFDAVLVTGYVSGTIFKTPAGAGRY
jgi:hypothetical protein